MISMPARFDKLGISFQYPENWTLDDSDAVLGRRSVTVTSPGGAFWSIAIQSGSLNPQKLAHAVVQAMRQEYGSVESEEVEETIEGTELVGYDLAFYYLDLTNTAVVRSFTFSQSAYTVFFQAEDREFAQLAAVFQAMTTSVLRGLRDPAAS